LSALNGSIERFQDAGAIVYGVNPASAGSHTKYVEKLRLKFPLIVDKGGRIARAFRSGWGPLVRRTVYVVSPDAKIVYAKRGAPPVEQILAAIGTAASRPPPTGR
jgi:peroxiredoxin Q/BCP